MNVPHPAKTVSKAADPSVQTVDTSYLESLMGYNARRASLAIISEFLAQMSVYGLRPVDFSVLSLITHNPGITSRQLCVALGLLPPNLVGLVNSLQGRELILRRPHPHDGRAMGLHLSAKGKKMMRDAEQTAAELERNATSALNPTENRQLMSLLKKIYQKPSGKGATA